MDAAQIAQLLANQQTLQQQIIQLTQQLAAVQAQPPPAPPPPARRKIPVAEPNRFSGQPELFQTFMGQCKLFMTLRPEDFPDDRARVGFVISYLAGTAAQWATPLITQNSPLMSDYRGFCQRLKEMYEDPLRVQQAARRLRDLQQGKRPLREYITEFRLLKQDSAWNEAALMDAFQEGLTEELQDELTRMEPPADLEALILAALRLEVRCMRRKARRPVAQVRLEPPSPAQTRVPSLPVARAVVPPVEPMEVGATRPHLTVQEKARRRQAGLCLYCGASGHFAASCPGKRRSSTGSMVGSPPGGPGNGGSPA